jgi:hypothetical protein
MTTFALTYMNKYPGETLHDAECKQAQKAQSFTILDDERAARVLAEIRRDIHHCLRVSKEEFSSYDWTKLGRLNDITVARKAAEDAADNKRRLAYRAAYLSWALDGAMADLTALNGWEEALDEATNEMDTERSTVEVTVHGSYSTRRY